MRKIILLSILISDTVRTEAWSTAPFVGLTRGYHLEHVGHLRSSQDDLSHDEDSPQSTPPEDQGPELIERISPTMTSKDYMRAMGTSPRRILLSGLSGAGIALAGNLFGVTSQLLKLVPEEQVEATGLDTYFPRGKNMEPTIVSRSSLSHDHIHRRVQEVQRARLYVRVSNRMGCRYFRGTCKGSTSSKGIRLQSQSKHRQCYFSG
jgi:hypothetical protein